MVCLRRVWRQCGELGGMLPEKIRNGREGLGI